MTSSSHPQHIVIVGAGIIGLGHAVAALDAGYRVTVLEQDAQAVLSSVRNFGHVCASVQAGELGELAREALPLWASLVQRAGVDARASGTLAVARSRAEAAVLEELITTRAPEGAALLTAHDTAERLGLSSHTHLTAGLWLPADLTADPRTAVASIARWVAAHPRGRVQFHTAVLGIEPGLVHTNRERLAADHIIVAAGHLVGRLFPSEAAGVRECALQMTRVAAPHPMGLGPAVLTGTSMLRYGAFAGPAAAALRRELEAEKPELIEIDANVMFTQQSDGTLLIGDSHVTHASAPPFLSEEWSRRLLTDAGHLLGAPKLQVLERWQGVYAVSDGDDVLRFSPAPGVTAITLTTGVGMTVGLSLGARTIAAL